MTPVLEQLPDDIDQLKHMIVELVSALNDSERANTHLTHRLNLLLRQSYGRKSERIDPKQLQLFRDLIEDKLASLGQETPKLAAAAEDESPASSAPTGRKPGHGRNAIPERLPRKEVVHDIRDDQRACPCCGGSLLHIGDDVSEQLEYIPASLYVKRHIRKKYACKTCENAPVVADAPAKPIQKGMAGPGLLAHIMVSKYADHLPLHRQEGILQRHGVEISRSTMCGWVRECAEEIAIPLYEAMKAEILKSRVIQTDDTPVRVLDETLNQTREGRLWVYLGDRDYPYAVYDYTPNRRGEGPEAFLGAFDRHLQADAYAGYERLYKRRPNPMCEVGCWAHGRRYFYDAKTSDVVNATHALACIARLYDVERKARNLDDERRKHLRELHARPILDAFHLWLKETGKQALPQSPMGKATGYALSNWTALNRYLEQGWLEIDNNNSERALRAIAVGRKNWLFAGSDAGGRRAAIIYSLIGSAKRHGVEPFAYLRDIFERLPASPARNIADFFPDRWSRLQPSS